MSSKMMKNAVALAAGALGVAGAVTIATASPSWAAPVVPNAAVAGTAASNQVTDVRYYRHGYYRHRYYGHRYYGHRYYRHGYGYRYGYPYGGYAYPYYYPYAYPYPYGWGW